MAISETITVDAEGAVGQLDALAEAAGTLADKWAALAGELDKPLGAGASAGGADKIAESLDAAAASIQGAVGKIEAQLARLDELGASAGAGGGAGAGKLAEQMDASAAAMSDAVDKMVADSAKLGDIGDVAAGVSGEVGKLGESFDGAAAGAGKLRDTTPALADGLKGVGDATKENTAWLAEYNAAMTESAGIQKANAAVASDASAKIALGQRVNSAAMKDASNDAVAAQKVQSDAAAAAAADSEASAKKHEMLVLGVAAAAGYSIYQAAQLQTQVTRLYTSAGEKQKNLGMIESGILGMAGPTATDQSQLAQGAYWVESAGFHGQSALTVLKAVAQGAYAEGAPIQDVANAATSIMTSYGMYDPTQKQANSVINQMLTAVGSGKMTMAGLSSALPSVLSVAQTAGLSLPQVLGSLATMTAPGLSPDRAAQNLGHTIGKLQNPTATMTAEMYQLGLDPVKMSQNLGKTGISGEMQEIQAAVKEHEIKTGPDKGMIQLPAMNISKAASQDALTMLHELPPAVRGVAQAYLDGKISTAAWNQEMFKGSESAEAKNLLQQFATVTNLAHGFNSSLKSGQPDVQAYNAAVSKVLGDSVAARTYLELTGTHSAVTAKNIAGVAQAAHDAGVNVQGWGEIQKTFNYQLKDFEYSTKASATSIGAALLPEVTTLMSGLAHAGSFLAANPDLTKALGIGGGVLAAGYGLSKVESGVMTSLRGFGTIAEKLHIPGLEKLAGVGSGSAAGTAASTAAGEVGGLGSAASEAAGGVGELGGAADAAAAALGRIATEGALPPGEGLPREGEPAVPAGEGEPAVPTGEGEPTAEPAVVPGEGKPAEEGKNKPVKGTPEETPPEETPREPTPTEPREYGGPGLGDVAMSVLLAPQIDAALENKKNPKVYGNTSPSSPWNDWTSPDSLGGMAIRGLRSQADTAPSYTGRAAYLLGTPGSGTSAAQPSAPAEDMLSWAGHAGTAIPPVKVKVEPETGSLTGFNTMLASAMAAKPVKVPAPDMTALTSAAGAAHSDGTAVASGFAAGIAAGTGIVEGSAAALANAAASQLHLTIKASSPSKVTEAIGKDEFDAGLAQGITAGTPAVQAAAASIGSSSVTSLIQGLEGGQSNLQNATQALIGQLANPDAVNTVQQTIQQLQADVPGDTGLVKWLGAQQGKLDSLANKQGALMAQISNAQQLATSVIGSSGVMSASGYTAAVPTAGGPQSSQSVISGMQLQLQDTQQFAQQLTQLSKMGLNATSVSQLAQAGVTAGLPVAEGLTQGGKGAVQQINALEAKIIKASQSVGATGGTAMYQAGLAVTDGLASGLKKDLEQVDKAMTKEADAVIAAVRKVAGAGSTASSSSATSGSSSAATASSASSAGSTSAASAAAASGLNKTASAAGGAAGGLDSVATAAGKAAGALTSITQEITGKPGHGTSGTGTGYHTASGGYATAGAPAQATHITVNVAGTVVTQQDLLSSLQNTQLQRSSNNWQSNGGWSLPGKTS